MPQAIQFQQHHTKHTVGWKIFKQLIYTPSRTLVSRYKIIQQVLHISCEEFLIFDLNGGAFCGHVNRFNEQLEEEEKKTQQTHMHSTKLHIKFKSPLIELIEFIVFMFFCTL